MWLFLFSLLWAPLQLPAAGEVAAEEMQALHTVRGMAMTPDGRMMPEFVVVMRPESGNPALNIRLRSKDGVFELRNLTPGSYRLEVSAPGCIIVRMRLELPAAAGDTVFRTAVLYPLPDELTPPEYLLQYSISTDRQEREVPETARRAFAAGAQFHREGKYDEAMTAYGNAIRAHPRHRDALAYAGAIYLLMRHYESAVAFLRRAQDVDSRNEGVRRALAAALIHSAQYADAMRSLEDLSREKPARAWVLYHLASAYLAERKYDRAERIAVRILEEYPESPQGWAVLLNIAMERGDAARIPEIRRQLDRRLHVHSSRG